MSQLSNLEREPIPENFKNTYPNKKKERDKVIVPLQSEDKNRNLAKNPSPLNNSDNSDFESSNKQENIVNVRNSSNIKASPENSGLDYNKDLCKETNIRLVYSTQGLNFDYKLNENHSTIFTSAESKSIKPSLALISNCKERLNIESPYCKKEDKNNYNEDFRSSTNSNEHNSGGLNNMHTLRDKKYGNISNIPNVNTDNFYTSDNTFFNSNHSNKIAYGKIFIYDIKSAQTILDLQDKIYKLQNENDQLHNREHFPLHDIHDLNKISSLTHENQNLKYDLEHRSKDINHYMQQNENLKKDYQESYRENETLKEELYYSNIRIENIQEKLNELLDQHQDYKKVVKNDNERANDKISDLEKSIENFTKEKREIEQQLRQSEDEKEQLTKKNKRLLNVLINKK